MPSIKIYFAGSGYYRNVVFAFLLNLNKIKMKTEIEIKKSYLQAEINYCKEKLIESQLRLEIAELKLKEIQSEQLAIDIKALDKAIESMTQPERDDCENKEDIFDYNDTSIKSKYDDL